MSTTLRRPALHVLAAAAMTLLPAIASAQAAPAVPVVRLASPQTPPGGETFVTVMLTNVPSQRIEVLETDIEYQANHLIYVAARPGFAADLAGATVDVTTRQVDPDEPPLVTAIPMPGPPPAKRPRTRISIVVKGKKPLANGPVAELRFRVGPAFTVAHDGVAEVDPTAPKPAAPAPTPAPPVPAEPSGAPGITPAAETPRTVIIRVAHHSEATAPEGAEVPLIAEAGEVRVTTERKGRVPIVFACFFYMH